MFEEEAGILGEAEEPAEAEAAEDVAEIEPVPAPPLPPWAALSEPNENGFVYRDDGRSVLRIQRRDHRLWVNATCTGNAV